MIAIYRHPSRKGAHLGHTSEGMVYRLPMQPQPRRRVVNLRMPWPACWSRRPFLRPTNADGARHGLVRHSSRAEIVVCGK